MKIVRQFLFAVITFVFASGCITRHPPAQADSALSLWTADSPARAALVAYVAAATDENGADYVPPEDRIAVFDLDGTLLCETDPNYFDYCLLVHRVLEDPEYRDKSTDFEREVANKIREQDATGASFPGLEVDHGRAVASAFAGLTPEEFNTYVRTFRQTPTPGYENMTRGEAFYQPMLQVVDLLRENGFLIYIVSGTDRFIVRGIVEDSPLDVPPWQIIGSDETVVARNQGDADGLNYVFGSDDGPVLGGVFVVKNLKMNKVSAIVREIGRRPVLAFGNSTGDASMANYVSRDNPHKSLAFMLCCDDLEREHGNEAKAARMRALCESSGWIPVSMKNDWTTIYGSSVRKK